MNKKPTLCETIKRLGYAHNNQVKLYGETFELLSDPIVIADKLVVVDALKRRSGSVTAGPHSFTDCADGATGCGRSLSASVESQNERPGRGIERGRTPERASAPCTSLKS